MKKHICMIIVFTFLLSMLMPSSVFAANAVTITSPNGGETWKAGNTYTITWQVNFVPKTTMVYATIDSGEHWTYLFGTTENVQSTVWAIPDFLMGEHTKIKVTVTDSNNNSYSDESDAQFTIQQGPLSPMNLTLTNENMTSIKITWMDMSDNETGFYIYRKIGEGSYSKIATLGANITTYSDPLSVFDATYVYMIMAYNSDGSSSSAPYGIIVPAQLLAPTQLTANAISGSKIDLAWVDNSSNEQGFKVFRKGEAGNFVLINTVSANVQTYSDTGLTPGKTYTYRVDSYLSTKLASSNTVSVKTFENTPEIHKAPSDMTAAPTKTGTGIYITWKDNSDNEVCFNLFRQEGAGSFALVSKTAPNATTYSDSGLKAGTTYTYKLSAGFEGGTSDSIQASATLPQATDVPTLPNISGPSAPSELKATLAADGSAQLSWNDNSTNETGFKLERNVSGSDSFIQIATVAGNVMSYVDPGPFSGTINYRVKAYNLLSSSTYSNTASIIMANSSQPDVPVVTDPPNHMVLRFYIDNVGCKVGEETQVMDVAPTLKNNRTLLPVRYVATPLGADVKWDPVTSKVTVELGNTKLEMWIGNNMAMVNGVSEMIDPDNPEVMPEILPPGRTMLPMRFIAEKLGCEVGWDPIIKEVKLTYSKQ